MQYFIWNYNYTSSKAEVKVFEVSTWQFEWSWKLDIVWWHGKQVSWDSSEHSKTYGVIHPTNIDVISISTTSVE